MRLRRSLICLTTLSILSVAPAAGAAHTSFAAGDLFVGVGNSKVQWRHPDGSLNQTMTTAVSSPTTTGMALGLSHNLYVTGYTANEISEFNSSGAAVGTFGGGFNSHPESIAFDTHGFAYVGQEGGSRDILKFDSTGTLVASYNAAPDTKGTDRLDVAGDQCTIFYTGQSKTIKRFDACQNTQLTNFASGLPGKETLDLKLLVGGGALVADTQSILRLNAAGGIAQAYDATGQNCWSAISLEGTTGTFLAGDRCSSNVYRFDIATGSSSILFTAGPKTSVQGIAVNQGLTAATAADVSVTLVDEPDPVSPPSATEPTWVHYRGTISNAGPGIARGVAVTLSVTGGTVSQAFGTDWSCAPGQTSTTCSLSGPLGIGATANPLDLVVQTAINATTVSAAATVSANEPDQAPASNSATESTTVAATNRNHLLSYCPSFGCVVDTDPDNSGPTRDDNTVTRLQLGPGVAAVVTIDESTTPTFECGTSTDDEQIEFVVPPGHDDPTDPAVVTVSLDTTTGVGGNARPCTKKDDVVFELPDCIMPGVASPSPCLDLARSIGGGVVQTRSLWLSGDPFIKH